MATYLITGGAGFIGSNIAQTLVSRGENVRILDNLATGKLENIARIRDRVEFIEGDIRDFQTVRAAVSGVDYVIHQAALPSVSRSIQDPVPTNETNVTGTLNVLLACREQKVKRFVMASSSSVYGDTPKLPKSEEMALNPLSPYATSKLAAERYAMNFYKLYGLETVALRYFNVFGPHQDPKSQYAAVIPKFITAILKGEPPVVYGDGEQSRDFTFVSNVVEANILACTAEKAPGYCMNIACGGRYTLNQLLQMLEEIIGRKANATYTEPRPGDIKHSHASIDLAREILNYEPKVSFEEGLRRTVGWYKEILRL